MFVYDDSSFAVEQQTAQFPDLSYRTIDPLFTQSDPQGNQLTALIGYEAENKVYEGTTERYFEFISDSVVPYLGTFTRSDTDGTFPSRARIRVPVTTTEATQGVADGVADIRARGPGIIEYSLNGTDWQDSSVFSALPAGDYTAHARTKREGEKSDTVTFEIAEKREYGVLYTLGSCYVGGDYVGIIDRNGKRIRVEILEQSYTGRSYEVVGSSDPIILKIEPLEDRGGFIHPTTLSISLLSEYERYFMRLFTPDEFRYQVRVYVDDLLFWCGYVLADLYSESFENAKYFVNIECSDGSGLLEYVTLAEGHGRGPEGIFSVLEIVEKANQFIGLPISIAENADFDLSQFYIEASEIGGSPTLKDAVEAALTWQGAKLMQWGGFQNVVSVDKFREWPMPLELCSEFLQIRGTGQLEMQPAFRTVSVQSEMEVSENLMPYTWTRQEDYFFVPNQFRLKNWSTEGYYVRTPRDPEKRGDGIEIDLKFEAVSGAPNIPTSEFLESSTFPLYVSENALCEIVYEFRLGNEDWDGSGTVGIQFINIGDDGVVRFLNATPQVYNYAIAAEFIEAVSYIDWQDVTGGEFITKTVRVFFRPEHNGHYYFILYAPSVGTFSVPIFLRELILREVAYDPEPVVSVKNSDRFNADKVIKSSFGRSRYGFTTRVIRESTGKPVSEFLSNGQTYERPSEIMLGKANVNYSKTTELIRVTVIDTGTGNFLSPLVAYSIARAWGRIFYIIEASFSLKNCVHSLSLLELYTDVIDPYLDNAILEEDLDPMLTETGIYLSREATS